MTLSVLSQASVDTLRMLAKKGEPILEQPFEDTVLKFNLQLIDIDIEFDNSIELVLPDGKEQETNNDGKNCMLISSAVPNLTDIEATDERLWVTLGLREYKDYTIARWPVKDEDKSVNNTINHWFTGSAPRGLMRDHAVSRLWWYHRLCSRIEERPANETLDLLFFNSDYRSSMLERNTTSAITEVVISIIEITDEYRKKGITYNREKFRDFMKSLDLLAGRSRLAVLSKKQLKTKLTTLYLAAHE